MSESQFGPSAGEADERTRARYPGQPASSQEQATQAGPAHQPPTQQFAPQQQQPPAQQFAPAGYAATPYGQPGQGPQPHDQAAPPAKRAGYFRSLFDLSYDNLGAPKFARVFQVLFMVVSGIAVVVALLIFARGGSYVPIVLGLLVLPLLWLLLNTLVRLILEAVVGIVQTAENTEQMLALMRDRRSS